MKVWLGHFITGPDEIQLGYVSDLKRAEASYVRWRWKHDCGICQVQVNGKSLKPLHIIIAYLKRSQRFVGTFVYWRSVVFFGWVLATWFCSFLESRILPKITNLSQTCKTLPLTWIIHMRRLARVCSHRAVVSDVDKIDMAVTTSMKWWL